MKMMENLYNYMDDVLGNLRILYQKSEKLIELDTQILI